MLVRRVFWGAREMSIGFSNIMALMACQNRFLTTRLTWRYARGIYRWRGEDWSRSSPSATQNTYPYQNEPDVLGIGKAIAATAFDAALKREDGTVKRLTASTTIGIRN